MCDYLNDSFKLGSTPEEVRRIQGEPLHVRPAHSHPGESWSYEGIGNSRSVVAFKDGKVCWFMNVGDKLHAVGHCGY